MICDRNLPGLPDVNWCGTSRDPLDADAYNPPPVPTTRSGDCFVTPADWPVVIARVVQPTLFFYKMIVLKRHIRLYNR